MSAIEGDGGDDERKAAIEERLRKMRATAKRCAALLRAVGPPIDHGELLYDERGLPKGSWAWDDPEEPAEPGSEP